MVLTARRYLLYKVDLVDQVLPVTDTIIIILLLLFLFTA